MAIRNNNWYNLNEQRDYPVDDTASAISDSDLRLPSSLVTDLRLRWPVELGRYAFISAAAVTPGIVTVMIEVSETPNNTPNTATLIAGISVPKVELLQGRTYVLETFQDKVGGFIVFGSGTEENYSGKFSSPEQTLLTARAARAIRQPPIPSIRTSQSAAKLTGLINLTAAEPLFLSKETRVIDGVEFDNVIVFKLQERPNTDAQDSVFSEFAGDCGKRTGSRSCTDPQPVETINGVQPDCDGIITLDFKGCSVVGRNVTDCGVILDCSLGLSASCEPPPLPNLETGQLPSEIDPVLIPPVIPPEPPVGPDISISESATTILTLPYCDTFDDGFAYGFSPAGSSFFGFIADDSPGEAVCCEGNGGDMPPAYPPTANPDGCTTSQSVSNSASASWDVVPIIEVDSSYGVVSASGLSRTNISLFTSDVQCLFRRYTTDLKIRTGAVVGVAGSLQNAGILLNYRITDSGQVNYHLFLVDIDNSTVGIYFFNGVTTVELVAVEITDLRADDWYRISVTGVPAASQTSVDLTLNFDGITDPSLSATLNVSVSSNTFGQDNGNVGLYGRRSISYFSFWRVQEAT